MSGAASNKSPEATVLSLAQLLQQQPAALYQLSYLAEEEISV
jgi:hypothetical protein